MRDQATDAAPATSLVKATFRLSSEIYYVDVANGILSEQTTLMKERSMSILKDFITRHNVPNDVPDEAIEDSSEDDSEATEKPLKIQKMTLHVMKEVRFAT